MSDITEATSKELEAFEEDDSRQVYKDLRPIAQRVLKRTMLTSGNEKLAVSVAQDILDRSGESKTPESKGDGTMVLVTNSQVNLLMQVAKELE